MVRPNTSSKRPQRSKKKQKSAIDFKRIKRRIGRKLPPPQNATNVEIKSKAIVLPEQSVASERVGLALSKKGLTLKELLQQTSHHNAKVRKDALIGIKDLCLKYPGELRLYKLALIEKLRERISDDNAVVRDTLYDLLKSVIFPKSKEEISGPFTSLMMAYIFNAMTHLAIDVRLMAFKFFDLVVQHFPSSFLLYAEKILLNYEDILQKHHIYLQDKSKLKNALGGLVHCLYLLPSTQREVETLDDKRLLHAYEPDVHKATRGVPSVIKKIQDLVPVLVRCFHELTPSVHEKPFIGAHSFKCMLCVIQSIDLAIGFLVHSAFESSLQETAMPVLLTKLLNGFPFLPDNGFSEKVEDRYYILNVRLVEIYMHYGEWLEVPPTLLGRILEFVEGLLSRKIYFHTRSSKVLHEKHLVALLPFIPRIISKVESDWKHRLLQAFTMAFKSCKPESSLSLACLHALEEMLLPIDVQDMLLDTSDTVVVENQITWIHELPTLLIKLGDKHPSCSKVVLHLILCLGQRAPVCTFLVWEHDMMQHSLKDFFCIVQEKSEDKEGCIQFGPFIGLPTDCQELAICSLYYFSRIDSLLLSSLAHCCLSNRLEPSVLFRLIAVLESSFEAGHIMIADYISFLITLLVRFKVYPERLDNIVEAEENSNHRTFEAMARSLRSCLSQIGENSLVFQMIQNVIVHEMSLNPPLHNMNAMLGVLAILESKLTSLSKESTIELGNSMARYLIDFSYCILEKRDELIGSDELISIYKHYLLPCFILLDNNDKLLAHVLNLMQASIAENKSRHPARDGSIPAINYLSHIRAVAFLLMSMHKVVKMKQSLFSCKAEIGNLLHCILHLQSANEMDLNLEERHKIQLAFDQMKTTICRTHGWNADDFGTVSRVD